MVKIRIDYAVTSPFLSYVVLIFFHICLSTKIQPSCEMVSLVKITTKILIEMKNYLFFVSPLAWSELVQLKYVDIAFSQSYSELLH